MSEHGSAARFGVWIRGGGVAGRAGVPSLILNFDVAMMLNDSSLRARPPAIVWDLTDIGGLMVRTLIGLPEADKEWLDQRAMELGVSMAELVRRAVSRFREEASTPDPGLLADLSETSGVWTEGDGLAWQERMRGEWASRAP